MKKEYETPLVEIMFLFVEDVITESTIYDNELPIEPPVFD